MTNEWQQFFDAYAGRYDQEQFTHHTEAEVAFIVEHLQPMAGARILDIGCGTGRHSVALARLGFEVTGVDLSAEMLALADKRAKAASVSVEWVHANAAEFQRPGAYEIAICLCEGAMCLLTTADDALERDAAILANIHSSLRPGGRFLLNVLNACRQIRAFSDDDVNSGRFDVVNLTERSDAADYLGETAPSYHLRERGYTPPEIRRMLGWAGFEVDGVYGGTAGSWGLRPLKLDEIELLLMAHRPA
jgi:SAM-dependent methyltransferase